MMDLWWWWVKNMGDYMNVILYAGKCCLVGIINAKKGIIKVLVDDV